jgi:hypothetical protein
MDNQDAVEVTCTDNGKKVIGYILNYRAKDQLEISFAVQIGNFCRIYGWNGVCCPGRCITETI